MAEIQYKRKAPAARLILCDRLDTVVPGNPVMISYHMGMRCYQHARHLVISNQDNLYRWFLLHRWNTCLNNDEKLTSFMYLLKTSCAPCTSSQGPRPNSHERLRQLSSTLCLLKHPQAAVRRLQRSYRWNCTPTLVVVHEEVSCQLDARRR